MYANVGREKALAKMNRKLNDARYYFTRVPSDLLNAQHDKVICLRHGAKARMLAKIWHLEEELASHNDRDFALVSGPNDGIEPADPKCLLELAVYSEQYQIILQYSDHLDLRISEIILLHFDNSNDTFRKVISVLRKRYPVMDKKCAKTILKNESLTIELYENIKHFGPKLYHWSYKAHHRTHMFQFLTRRKCPANNRVLNLAISRPINQCAKKLLQLGASLNEESQEIMDNQFSHWLFCPRKELLQMYVKYGIDPMTANDQFPKGSFDRQIRFWLKAIRGKTFCYRDSYRREFQICLPRIKEAEPKVYERLMLLEP